MHLENRFLLKEVGPTGEGIVIEQLPDDVVQPKNKSLRISALCCASISFR